MKYAAIALLALAMTGCATKSVGRMYDLNEYDRKTMSCPDLAAESVKVDQFIAHKDEVFQFDGGSVLSFLLDFGLGNSLEQDVATKTAEARKAQIVDMQVKNGCGR